MDGNIVIRKLGLLLGVAACGALVTSCGGGGSSEPTPTPTGTSTATPTPTPTTSVVFDLSEGFEVVSANANLIYAFFTPTGGVETFNDGARINGQSRVSLDFSPEVASFQFPDLEDPATFDEADLASASDTSRVYAEGDRQLILEVPYSHSLRTIYEIDDQPFTRNTVAGTLRSQRVTLFFNTVTTTSDITSTLSYTGTAQAFGGQLGTTPSGAISANPATFTVTPGSTNDTISGTIAVFSTVDGTTTQVASIPVNTTLNSSGGFSGSIDEATYGLKGNYAGSLAGPNRDELVLMFAVANADNTRKFVGSYIGD